MYDAPDYYCIVVECVKDNVTKAAQDSHANILPLRFVTAPLQRIQLREATQTPRQTV